MRKNTLKLISIFLAALFAASTLQILSFAVAKPAAGIDLAGMDKSVDPGDDFFEYANGTWMKTTKIPEDRSSYGIFNVLADEANQQTAELIRDAAKSAKGTEARKVGDYYEAFMNTRAIEEKGLSPIKPQLDEINRLGDKTALARLLGSQIRADVDPLNSTNFYTDRIFG